MPLPRVSVGQVVHRAANGPAFLAVCVGLAALGSLTALFPVTTVLVPATLLVPARWRLVAAACALGSAIGATALAGMFHRLGWSQVTERFPELAASDTWHQTVNWVSDYGAWALCAVAATPLPQTPALLFFAIARQDYAAVFAAMLAGKLLKYGVIAWLTARFPERVRGGLGSLWHRLWGG